jgi:murein DD-endopeptidase MepM/ murein hydrolase activator NlpD
MDSSQLIGILKKYSSTFHPVVQFDPGKEKLLFLDSSQDNRELTTEIINDTQHYTNYINHKLKNSGSKFAIGGYNELRSVYKRSKVFNANDGEEPRRLHLGIDIWGKPHTAVMAPLRGIIHSFAFNNNFGDYGATIILTHNLDGFSFHTLYGHLSLNSIKNLREGDTAGKGDVIGEFGIPMENGQWPPHLHFQIIIDIKNWKGDYPGVCKFSEKEKYLSNSPDPDLILQMMKYAVKNE